MVLMGGFKEIWFIVDFYDVIVLLFVEFFFVFVVVDILFFCFSVDGSIDCDLIFFLLWFKVIIFFVVGVKLIILWVCRFFVMEDFEV